MSRSFFLSSLLASSFSLNNRCKCVPLGALAGAQSTVIVKPSELSLEPHLLSKKMCVNMEHSNILSEVGLVDTGRLPSGDFANLSLCLLEMAANNDVEALKCLVDQGTTRLDMVGKWYTRHTRTKQMILEERTPAMIAALYGSLDVLRYILKVYSSSEGDVNQHCGNDSTTALHCAAAGGSVQAAETAKLLLEFGADVDACDAHGRRPVDVIAKSIRDVSVKMLLESLLKSEKSSNMACILPELESKISCGTGTAELNGPRTSSDMYTHFSPSLSSASQSPGSSPPLKSMDMAALKVLGEGSEKVKEYPVDPSIPDIKSSAYSTDEFRMYSFKVRPCSRAYSHDWTECPFVHPGENARRRDPRKYHYSCVPCPDFRKGACRQGDMCEYAHGVFECWLHPAQYRTRLCKDGTGCARRVCFFAHTIEELRPLYVSPSSAVHSLKGTSLSATSLPLATSSVSSILMMNPFLTSSMLQNDTHGNLATPPLSPSSPSACGWLPGSVPTLHLPGANLHGSKFRAEVNARGLSLEDLGTTSDVDGQISEFSSFPFQALSTQARVNAAIAASSSVVTSNQSCKYGNLGISVAPVNLEELFTSERSLSPSSIASPRSLFSPRTMSQESMHSSHLEARLLAYRSRRQSQIQNEPCGGCGLSPLSDHLQLQVDMPLMGAQSQEAVSAQSPSLGSLARMSAHVGLESDKMSTEALSSPSHIAASPAFMLNKRSNSSRELGCGFKVSDWGSPTGKPDWGVQGDELSNFKRSQSLCLRQADELINRGLDASTICQSGDIVMDGGNWDAGTSLLVLES